MENDNESEETFVFLPLDKRVVVYATLQFKNSPIRVKLDTRVKVNITPVKQFQKFKHLRKLQT